MLIKRRRWRGSNCVKDIRWADIAQIIEQSQIAVRVGGALISKLL